MNIGKYIIYILFLVLTLLFLSCKKSKENKLIGTWANQPLESTIDESDFLQLWTFDAASGLVVKGISADTVITMSGIYSVSSKNMGMSGYYIQITNVDGLLDGKYRIKNIDDLKMSLHRIELADGNTAGAFLWKDFIKQE